MMQICKVFVFCFIILILFIPSGARAQGAQILLTLNIAPAPQYEIFPVRTQSIASVLSGFLNETTLQIDRQGEEVSISMAIDDNITVAEFDKSQAPLHVPQEILEALPAETETQSVEISIY